MVTLLAAVDLGRLGGTLLIISRPRPITALLAYWIGCVGVSIPTVLFPLMLLHFVPTFRPFAENTANAVTGALSSSTGRHVQLGMGALALALAGLMAARYTARRRGLLSVTSGAPSIAPGNPPATVLQPSSAGNPILWLLNRGHDAATENTSAVRRLLGRLRNSWETGSFWIAFAIGWASGPPPIELLFLVTVVVASGAAIGTQVTAAVAFVLGMLAVVEVILLGYLARPAKTEAAAQRLGDSLRTHRPWVLVAVSALMGAWLVTVNL